jgi:hypothetical protein
MTITIQYLWQKFDIAVSELVANGSLQERLRHVSGRLPLLHVEDFPIDALRERYRKVLGALERIDAMTDDERYGLATEIVALFSEVTCKRARDDYEDDWLNDQKSRPEEGPPGA